MAAAASSFCPHEPRQTWAHLQDTSRRFFKMEMYVSHKRHVEHRSSPSLKRDGILDGGMVASGSATKVDFMGGK